MIEIRAKDETTATLVSSNLNIIKSVQEALQFRPENYFFNPKFKAGIWDGWIRPVDMYGNFQKGLMVEVCTVLENMDEEYIVNAEEFPAFYETDIALCDTNKISDGKGEIIKPFDYQTGSAEWILENKRGIVLAPTGAGKSLIIYLAIRSLLESDKYKKILVLVPTVGLVTQLYKDIQDYSEFEPEWNSVHFCHQIMAGEEKNNDKMSVYISTWQSIYGIKDKSYFEQFDAIFVDETHTADASSITGILNKCINARVKIGLSGTLKKTKLHITNLKGLFGEIHETTTTKDLMDKGILSNLEITSIVFKHKGDIPRLEYKDELTYIVTHEKRNKFICNLVNKQEGNSLILFQLVEKQGKPLLKMMKEMFPDKEVHYISGSVKATIREEIRQIVENSDSAVIIASYQTFQQGINIKKLHNVIFASPSKSNIRVFQSIGRALRKHKTKDVARLFDIADDMRGNKKTLNHTLNHFKERIKMYYEEGFKVKYLELDL